MLRQLHRLGWEPVPHAVSASGAVIERIRQTDDRTSDESTLDTVDQLFTAYWQ